MKRVIKSATNDSFEAALDAAQITYEYGTYFEEDDFEGDHEAYAIYFDELLNLGPEGFYEEYKDQLDFSDEFVAEYGYDEDEDDEEGEDW